MHFSTSYKLYIAFPKVKIVEGGETSLTQNVEADIFKEKKTCKYYSFEEVNLEEEQNMSLKTMFSCT
jgi:hypothetical protein